MIVADSSALVAILEEEDEHQTFKAVLSAAARRIVSAVTLYETSIVLLRRRGPDGPGDVRVLIETFDFEVLPFDQSQCDAALEAYARFGKGIDPVARLNLGDCVAYALAKRFVLRCCSKAMISRRPTSPHACRDTKPPLREGGLAAVARAPPLRYLYPILFRLGFA